MIEERPFEADRDTGSVRIEPFRLSDVGRLAEVEAALDLALFRLDSLEMDLAALSQAIEDRQQ